MMMTAMTIKRLISSPTVVLSVLVPLFFNFGWVLWCWHDQTCANFSAAGMRCSEYRAPFATDHLSAIAFGATRTLVSAVVFYPLWTWFVKEWNKNTY